MTDYGPHRPEDAPNAVPVLHADRRSGVAPYWSSEPMPHRLLEQRRQLNQRAAGLAVDFDPPPLGRPRPVVATAATERGRCRLVECAVLARRGLAVPLMWGAP